MDHIDYDLLYKVDSPSDLKRLAVAQLPRYCRELRQYIIEECSKNPGHLASSLGAVELTVAIHYVYDTPHDKLVWDVGHQAYAHKIITGRRDLFPTNRKEGGISGFPRMAESEYDSFGAGHSSTSISAAYGLAKAAELRGERSRVVAVIGDGAMTGGLAFEGLNNAGADKKSDILVILNDNEMAIDQATGALTGYLTRVSTSKRYNRLKRRLWSVFAHIPPLLRICQKTGNAVKQGLLQNSNLFESLNFRYFGQIDGHDIEELVRILTALKDIGEPKLLHVITTKGKGYTPAEDDQAAWHAPGRFNPDTGERLPSKTAAARYQDVFGETLLDLARADERIVGITPAMPSGCSMNVMMHAMPERCFDVGIAEGHAVTFSAGLAAGGMHPVCNIYSSFMQRAYDNVIHDVALQNLPVTFCIDRGGLVGEDGATHHGAFDLAYFSCVPNMIVAAPMDEAELRDMLYKPSHPYSWPVIGLTPEHIERVTDADVRAWFYTHYAPNNAVLAVVGNIAPERMRELAEKWFGDIPRRDVPQRSIPADAYHTAAAPGDLWREIDDRVPSPMVLLAWPMAAYGAEGYTEADIITDLLSAGRASRLRRNVMARHPELLADAEASIIGSEHDGMLLMDCRVVDNSRESIIRARECLLSEAFALTVPANIPQHELDRAVNRFEARQAVEELSIVERARRLAAADELVRRRRVTIDSIAATARKIFLRSDGATLIIRPES